MYFTPILENLELDPIISTAPYATKKAPDLL